MNRSGRATVAIVLSNYNHGRYLPESLGAICSQTRPADEIIVIDDGSTDGSAAVIETFAGRHSAIRFLRNERNLGLQESIARALPQVASDYLVWAASDDRLLPRFLEKSMAALERHPEAGLCFSELSVLKGDTGEIERFTALPTIKHIFDLSDLPEYMPPVEIVRRMKRAYLPISSSCHTVVVRRDALLEIGGYPGELEWHSDAFAYMAVAVRHGACVVPETLALIRATRGSYSQRGMHDRVLQTPVLQAMLGLLARREYRDVRRAFRRAPSNFSPFHTLMLELQMRRIRDWDLFVPYLIWTVGEYRRGRGLGWPRTFWELGLRLFSVAGAVAAWRIQRARQVFRRRQIPMLLARLGDATRTAPGAARELTSTPKDAYTLIVLTYNRTPLLSRLLDYLEREGADFPLLILDSSADEARQANVDRIRRSSLPVRHVPYPTDVHPYLKAKAGAQLVTTPFASICADDDVVLLPAVRQCVRVLDGQPDISAAHGYYFNFSEGESFDLSSIVYRAPSLLGDDPLTRVREMFATYEAVFYAVYRTPVLQGVFRRVGELRTVLGRELATAALTAVSGKVVRLKEFYYGRNTSESHAYEHWHPYQVLVSSPELLFEECRRLREIVQTEVVGAGGGTRQAEPTQPLLELVFLRYLIPFLRPEVVDLIIGDWLKGVEAPTIFEHLWDVFVRGLIHRPRYPLEPLTGAGGAGFAPDRFKEGDRWKDYVHPSLTAWGAPRAYRVRHEFLFPEAGQGAVVGKKELLALVDRLNAY